MVESSFSVAEAELINDGVYTTNLTGLYYIPHKVMPDDRGFYAELARIPEIETVTGNEFTIKQLNLSHSRTNVIRGFHAEQWNKLATITTGVCFAALADIRPDSATFGQVETFLFGPEDTQLQGSLFITAGIANSFCVLEGPVDYLYAVDKLYTNRDPAHDVAISLFDAKLNVEWPIDRQKMIISERDQQAITLQEKFPEQF